MALQGQSQRLDVAQNAELHQNPDYGVGSYSALVSEICNNLEVRHLLDFGCGKAKLFSQLRVNHPMTLQAYDPAVEAYAKPPVPAEFVTCIDVLEHIDANNVEMILDDLQRLTQAVLFVSVCTCPALKTLPDGRNAHLTQQPLQWWLPKLWERFTIQTVQMVNEHNFYVIAYALPLMLEDTSGEKLGANN